MSATRLPGVYFQTVVQPVPEVLPRMDIPAFVGFAASGPFDVPVAVEDTVHFHDVFGKDQPLAWDTQRGELAYAQLAPAVRAFFRNGGRRCWIVRVADNASAVSNGFLVPGLLETQTDGSYTAASLVARSEGSWSDDLMVNATITADPLDTASVSIPQGSPNGSYAVKLQPGAPCPFVAGDMLQLIFSGHQASPPAATDAVLFLPIEEVGIQFLGQSPQIQGRPATQQFVLSGQKGFWFRPSVAADFPASPPGSPAPVSDIVWMKPPTAATWLTQPANLSLPVLGWGFSTTQNGFVLETTRSATNDLQSGNWLRLDFDPSVLPPGAKGLLLLVGNILGSAEDTSQTAFSPAASVEAASVFAASAWWILDEASAMATYHAAPAPRTTGLGLELWVRDARATVTTLPELQFVPNPVAESRYLGYLPTDVALFRVSDRAEIPPGEALREEVTSPRFPLASPGGGDSATDLPIYLPLGVPGFLREDFYEPALPQSLSSLERDGLAPQTSCSHFSAGFFLDPDLANSNVLTLMTEAFHKQYQLAGADSNGVPLVKMHAILPVDEVSLLAVPDAIHRGWVSTLQTQATLAAPILTNISDPDSSGQVRLTWDQVIGATSYTVQQSSDPQFATADDVWQGDPVGSPAQSGPIAEQSTCPQAVYFRVRAQGTSGVGPWSNTLSRELPSQTFEVCNPDPLVAPTLVQTADNRGRISLSWSITTSNVDAFQLQVANEPAFELPELVYAGTQTTFEIWKSPLQTSYFRVAAQRHGENSPFSNTVTVAAETSVQQWQMVESDDGSDSTGGACEDELLNIHQAMLRLCAARADMSGLLSLPRQYGTDAALNYKNRLTNLLRPEEVANILSYGALYHPWMVVRDASDDSPGAIRGLAPDGTVCGTCASRTLTSGAWVSPANEVLEGVVDLDPVLDDVAVASFFANQINVTRQESRGFLCLSSQTLSTDSSLVEFNVRRLLILLRRVALRDGMPYVFQQNDTNLRYLVRRNFEDLLSRLYALGAFAGDTEDQAFRVVTDSSVNTPATADQGQFIVELRVAPSLPLEFLTVRLVQTGGEITFTEGV
ncbi:MAG TPA: hypothetical protein VE377_25670 [Candidatus Dormibacteraeota bacterium]|nr:hypothetical protein [Candidatus Dormibacteraeota bacterium]